MFIAQQPYFRDVWCLGPSSNGYRGAFPRGLIPRIRSRWWGKERLWLFSGSHKDPDGTTVDINPRVNPTHVADCERLPFSDDQYDFVMLDPPYSPEEARELYGTEYPSMVKVLNEAARVCRPHGYVILLHRLVPMVHPRFSKVFSSLELKAIVGIFTIAGMANIRALCVWQKPRPQDELTARSLHGKP